MQLRFEANNGGIAINYGSTGFLPRGLYECRKGATNSSTVSVNGTDIGSDNSFSAFTSPHTGDFLDGARQITSSVQRFSAIVRRVGIVTAALTTGERNDLRALINGRYSLW